MNLHAMSIAALPLVGVGSQMADNPLSASHRRELAVARDRVRPIRSTARVAAFNAWSSAVIAALSVPFSIGSPVGMALTVGIAIVAFNEFRGRKKLLNFEPAGASLLGWNQLGLLAMITVYCLWMMNTSLAEGSSLSAEIKGLAELDSSLAGTMDSLQPMIRQAVRGFYLGVIVISTLFQGGTALYYFSRRRLIEAFIAETPDWVRDIERSALNA